MRPRAQEWRDKESRIHQASHRTIDAGEQKVGEKKGLLC